MNLHAPSMTSGATPMKGTEGMNNGLLIPVTFVAMIPATCVPMRRK